LPAADTDGFTQADQQWFPAIRHARVDMHTHMDATTQYANAIEAMDQWGGTSVFLWRFVLGEGQPGGAMPAGQREADPAMTWCM